MVLLHRVTQVLDKVTATLIVPDSLTLADVEFEKVNSWCRGYSNRSRITGCRSTGG